MQFSFPLSEVGKIDNSNKRTTGDHAMNFPQCELMRGTFTSGYLFLKLLLSNNGDRAGATAKNCKRPEIDGATYH